MRRATFLLGALIVGSALCGGRVSGAPWKKHPITVIPGVPMKAADIKPYTPPKLEPEPPLEPSDVKLVEVTAEEAVIEIRPYSSPMVGNAIRGARLPVKGVVPARGRGDISDADRGQDLLPTWRPSQVAMGLDHEGARRAPASRDHVLRAEVGAGVLELECPRQGRPVVVI